MIVDGTLLPVRGSLPEQFAHDMGVSRTPMLSAGDELLNDGPIWAKFRERRAVCLMRLAEHEAILRCVANRELEASQWAVHAHFHGGIRDFLEMTAGSEHAPLLAVSTSSSAS